MNDRTCSVNGCPRPTRSSGSEWCNTHYFRVRRNGTPGSADIWDRTPKPCAIEGCERTTIDGGLGWCGAHYQRHKNHGDPTYVTPRPTGPDHRAWVGDNASYRNAHDRVKAKRGRAAEHPCAHGCGQMARHWSYDHTDPDEKHGDEGPYSLDTDRYAPLCVPCHKRSDLDHIKARTA